MPRKLTNFIPTNELYHVQNNKIENESQLEVTRYLKYLKFSNKYECKECGLRFACKINLDQHREDHVI